MKWTQNDIPGLEGKVIIVTGGNSGLGFETVKALASKGASVVMASRSTDRADKAKRKILKSYPDAIIDIIELDLADLDSVERFAMEYQKKYSRLDVLINNAGVMSVPYRLTKIGCEEHLAINHLGHFALTANLFKTISKTEEARIVNISSIAHKKGRFDFTDLKYDQGKSYSRMDAYRRSKLANLYFTYGLQDYFNKNNHTALAVAAHPGITESNIARHMLGEFFFRILKPLIKTILQKASIGALPQIRAAVDPCVKGGEYYGPRGLFEWSGYPVPVEPHPRARDQDGIKKLWQISEKLTGTAFP